MNWLEVQIYFWRQNMCPEIVTGIFGGIPKFRQAEILCFLTLASWMKLRPTSAAAFWFSFFPPAFVGGAVLPIKLLGDGIHGSVVYSDGSPAGLLFCKGSSHGFRPGWPATGTVPSTRSVTVATATLMARWTRSLVTWRSKGDLMLREWHLFQDAPCMDCGDYLRIH